jgi:hypothetical protein
MPTTLWFDAVTDDIYTAWEDVDSTAGLSIGTVALDMRTGSKSYSVKANGTPLSGVPIAMLDTYIAEISGSASGPAGQVTITPRHAGTTQLQLGPYPGYPTRLVTVTVIDTRATGVLSISPAPVATLDLMFGGITFTAYYNGLPIVAVGLEADNANIELVDVLTDNDGKFRVEPLAIGTTSITVTLDADETYYTVDDDGELTAITGISGVATVVITIISTSPSASVVTAIRLSPSTPLIGLPIGGKPRSIVILDNQFNPLPMRNVEADVSLPGYVRMSSDSKGGTFKIHTVSVGEGKIAFSYITNIGTTCYLERRFTVLP